MAVSPDTLIDGSWKVPDSIGPQRLNYPFRANGDRVTAFFEEDYLQRIDNYTPQEMPIPFYPGSDFYSILESQPRRWMADLYAFTRTWSRVPVPQITYSSRVITKPAPSSYGTATDFLSNPVSPVDLGGGTTYNGYLWGDNQVYGPYLVSTSVNSGSDTRVTTSTPHGIAGTEAIVIRSGSLDNWYRVLDAGYTVIDATNIDILGVNLGTSVDFLGKYLRAYTPGTDRVGTKNTQNFYLPLVTTGITTAADIPIPAVLLNDVDFFAAVVANLSGYVTYDASELSRWMESVIHTQMLTAINFGDV